jgi:hypothetical protein
MTLYWLVLCFVPFEDKGHQIIDGLFDDLAGFYALLMAKRG